MNMTENKTSLRSRKAVTGQFSSALGNERIYYKSILPSKGASGTELIVVHDLFHYHLFYEDFFLELQRLIPQISVTFMDLKGHGLSSGTRFGLENFSHFSTDLKKLIEVKDTKEVILFGHGLGGLVVSKALQDRLIPKKYKVKGVVLANPMLRTNYSLPRWTNYIHQLEDIIPDNIKVDLGIDGHELTDDPSVAERFNSDSLVSTKISFGLHQSIQEASREVRVNPYYLSVPTLFLMSDNNVLVDNKINELFYKGIDSDFSVLKSYSAPHDLVNSNIKDVVLTDISKWLKGNLRGQSN